MLFAAGMVGLSLMLLWWAVADAARLPWPFRQPAPRWGRTDLHQLTLSRPGHRAVKPLWRLSPVMRSAGGCSLAPGPPAGEPKRWPIQRVLAAKFVLGNCWPRRWVLLLLQPPLLRRPSVRPRVTALGFFSPDLLLYNQAQKRQMAIQDELADTIDQITVSVEAGMGFEAALSRAARTGTGPLGRGADPETAGDPSRGAP